MKTNLTHLKPILHFRSTLLCVLSLVFWGCENSSTEEIKYTLLTSDGPHDGLGAYQLIVDKLGRGSIEAPDLFENGHTEVRHIYEDEDPTVGNHFVFTLHLNEDGNCAKCGDGKIQRNEIKVHKSSMDELKGGKGDTYRYSWKFKIDEGFTVSKRFTNFFQIKPYNKELTSPIIKLTARKRGSKNVLEIQYKSDPFKGKFENLGKVRLKKNIGEWFQITCQATFDEADKGGKFLFDMKSLEDGRKVFSIKEDSINMWSGGNTQFMRPKWGIVRSIKDKEGLREDEERIRYADIEIQKIDFDLDVNPESKPDTDPDSVVNEQLSSNQ